MLLPPRSPLRTAVDDGTAAPLTLALVVACALVLAVAVAIAAALPA